MRKILSAVLVSFIFLFSVFILPSSTFAACGDGATNGLCGAAGGCADGQICIDTWVPGDAACEAANGRCDNRDNARAEICGFTNSTDGWCGESGGCASGYMCNSDTQTCEDSVGCKHIKNVYDSQCYKTWGTTNECGAQGFCEEGYRCMSIAMGSRTGYACQPIANSAGEYCPGSPQTPAVTLACGEESTNPNTNCNCAGNADGTPHSYGVGTTKYCCGWVKNATCLAQDPATPLICGQTSSDSAATCNCQGTTLKRNTSVDPVSERNKQYCCGWTEGKNCITEDPAEGTPGDTSPDTSPDEGGGGGEETATLDIFEGPTSADFALLDPIRTFSTDAKAKAAFTSPGGIISRILLFAFPLAGLILFVMLVWAGFQILAGSAQGSKAIEAGRQRATTAILGFVLLFVGYWVMQIIEVIFGITIL